MKLGILAALIAVLVALYFVFGSDFLAPASSSAVTTSGGDTSAKGDGTSPVHAPRRHSADKSGEESPDDDDDDDENAEPAGDEEVAKWAPGSGPGVTRTRGTSKVYTRHDGTIVRDHRPNPPPPDLDGYVVLPDAVSKVKSSTLVAVRRALRVGVTDCITSHGSGGADGAYLQLLLLTSIASENLRVDKTRVKISGLDQEDALRSCVEEATLGHEQAVAGAEDVNLHRMVFRYRL
jgi:hypothetical protein